MGNIKIAFIGGGNMGEAMVSAILKNGLSTPHDIYVSDISNTRRQHLEQKYSVLVTGDNRLAVEKSDIVVLAIKPQNLAEITAGLKSQLKPTQLVLSIIAGARIATLCQGLKHRQVARAMPTTPAQIGE